jgi:hypothetical protein
MNTTVSKADPSSKTPQDDTGIAETSGGAMSGELEHPNPPALCGVK